LFEIEDRSTRPKKTEKRCPSPIIAGRSGLVRWPAAHARGRRIKPARHTVSAF